MMEAFRVCDGFWMLSFCSKYPSRAVNTARAGCITSAPSPDPEPVLRSSSSSSSPLSFPPRAAPSHFAFLRPFRLAIAAHKGSARESFSRETFFETGFESSASLSRDFQVFF